MNLNLPTPFGALRTILIVSGLIVSFLVPEPGTAAAMHGWEIFPTLVVPAITPLVFTALLFDFMMCRIRMSDPAVRKKFRFIGYTELGVALFLLALWSPFFWAIGR